MIKDPEIMAEAKKMMESPEFQKQMKQLSGSKEFKDSIKNAESVMADPSRAAEMEARMEHMIKRGNDELKKGAANMMEDTMAAMMENPALMNEMTQMLKDPNFQQQLAEMMKDPSFASYREAVSDNDRTRRLSCNLSCTIELAQDIFCLLFSFSFSLFVDARHDE
jgi:hypothetical protein